MTHQEEKSTKIDAVLELLSDHGFDGMANAIGVLMNEAMKIERQEFLGAGPYERTEGRQGYSNGFKQRVFQSRAGSVELAIPQVRAKSGEEPLSFYPRSLEKGLRSERALKLSIAEMFVQGVSTRKVESITKELCGLDVTSTQVSRCAKLLDDELEQWRERPLGEVPYLILDARYEKVRHGGSVVNVAVLIAMGVRNDGKRTVLGVSVSLSEAEVHWRQFLESLQDRGLHGIQAVTSDDHSGLKAAIAARMPGVIWNRCQVHLQRNATHHVPRNEMRGKVAADLRAVFCAQDQREADDKLKAMVARYQKSAPKLADWLESDVPEGLAVFGLPEAHRKRMRTSNSIERLNREVKRRTRVATLFPNEASLLRLVSAVLAEVSEEWESGKVYLTMENR